MARNFPDPISITVPLRTTWEERWELMDEHGADAVMQFYGVAATCRVSFAFYNTHAEVEAFVTALRKVRTLLA